MHNSKLQSIFHPLHIHIDNFFVCFSMKKQIPSLLLKDSWLYLLYPATGWGGLAGAYNIGKSVVTYSNAYKKIPYNITFLGWVGLGISINNQLSIYKPIMVFYSELYYNHTNQKPTTPTISSKIKFTDKHIHANFIYPIP